MKRNWEYKNIEECLEKVAVASKLQTKDFLSEGEFPIVSQEADYISGYWNNESDVVRLLHPVVVFGDHSRAVKYIDFDFVVGADGVKILSPKDFLNPKFLYYFVKSADIPSLGYSRHYKLLREKDVPVPPLSEQSRIVAELDLLTGIIDRRNAQLKELDNLAQSIFYDMFGDPIENPKGWEVQLLKQHTTKIGSGATPKGGNESYKSEGIPLIRSLNVYNGTFKYKDLAHIDENQAAALDNVILQGGDVLLNITGASVARCCIVPCDLVSGRVNQHVAILRPKDSLKSVFLCAQLISSRYQQKLLHDSKANGATREALTKSQLEGLPIILPPLALQQSFAEKIQSIEKQKESIRASIADTQKLLDYTMDKYFG